MKSESQRRYRRVALGMEEERPSSYDVALFQEQEDIGVRGGQASNDAARRRIYRT